MVERDEEVGVGVNKIPFMDIFLNFCNNFSDLVIDFYYLPDLTPLLG